MRFDFPILARDLERVGLSMDAAAFHGTLCGWLCAGRSDVAGLRRELLPSEASFDRLPSDWFERSLSMAAEDLDDGMLGFHPLLPADERPLAERVRALAAWCDAFLGAYGLGGGGEEGDAEKIAILGDLAAIARADDAGVDDSDEESFMEIVEYVRVAAIYLRMSAFDGAGRR